MLDQVEGLDKQYLSESEQESMYSVYNDGENVFRKEHVSQKGSYFVSEIESFNKISKLSVANKESEKILHKWFVKGVLLPQNKIKQELPIWKYICKQKYNIKRKSDLFKQIKLKKKRSKEQYVKFVFRQFINKEIKRMSMKKTRLSKHAMLEQYYRDRFGNDFKKYKLFSHVKNKKGFQTISVKYLKQLNNDYPEFIDELERFAKNELLQEYFKNKNFKKIAKTIKKKSVDWKNNRINKKRISLPLDVYEVKKSRSCFLKHLNNLLKRNR